MYREELKRELARAEKNVALCESHIAKQRELVAMFECEGLDTAMAKRLLAEFEATLAAQKADRERLAKELAAHAD